jgi:hypothetical protein
MDGIVRGGRNGEGSVWFFGFVCGFWGWVKKVGWGISEPNRAASHAARLRSGQEAGVGSRSESHGRRVDGFLRVSVGGDVV